MDHPRSRGEHVDRSLGEAPHMGSSPLARGAQDAIAAYFRRAADHPRSRGEHQVRQWRRATQAGSSPLARGARGQDPYGIINYRIIPARAGSTPRRQRRRALHRDHPRSRGEHVPAALPRLLVHGSSPLARGALVAALGIVMLGGIIPARAGSTYRYAPLGRQLADHPRSRGEHDAVR